MAFRYLFQSISDGIRLLVSRKVYLVCLIAVPILFTLFFLNLMDSGLPLKIPAAVVDLDHSPMSRRITRSLSSAELIDVVSTPESYHKAMLEVRSGKTYGFFMIPENFQEDAIAGKQPTITYYCNLTYFVPGSLMFKGFKTTAVTTSGGLVQTDLVSAGLPQNLVGTAIQPVVIQTNSPGNPWMNYNYYLTNSFVPALLGLMLSIVAAFTLLVRIKEGRSRLWLQRSGNSIITAVTGTLLPQTIIGVVVGLCCQGLLYGFNHFPLNCSVWHMIWAMVLFVMACQGFAVAVCGLVPNLRLAVSICSLASILAFSIAAFSFPVQNMYPEVGIFSYILPVRYYFLIYIDQALNGIPLYYSRFYYIALILFPIVSLLTVWRIKRAARVQYYIP